ncbi:MAG: 50S ribosome-binding GTPase, partial [Ureaplasma sp.]|nr:50S ribosome-binding GTPase [Ureaplasma sp.]
MNVNNKKIKQEVECGLNINWFPGHMKKSLEEIGKIVNKVNLIIEVLDARAINTSSNDELLNIVGNKPILKIALKSDYSDLKNSNDIFVCNIKEKNLRNKIINEINKKLKSQFESAKRKGLIHPKFIILVIGLPNVGKSTLINILKNKNTLITQNFPGVTKKQTIVNINNELNLIDTPGVLFKHIEQIEDAYKLTLINSIKKEIVPLDKVLEYGFN